MKNIGKYRGCLIGGAVGDALGYHHRPFSRWNAEALFSILGTAKESV